MKDEWLEINGNPCIVTIADGHGEAIVNGRKWRWDFSKRSGPIFMNADGSDRKVQPSVRHPVWKAFDRWLKKEFKNDN